MLDLGEANKLLPDEVGKRQIDVLKPDEVHVIPGRGYALAWDALEGINHIVESLLDRHPAKTREHRKAR